MHLPPLLGAWHEHTAIGWMCCPAVRDAESRPLLRPGEISGERLRHWGRAALELRRVRRGSARIPLWGNPGRESIGKAPEKVSQEPDSVTTRFSTNPNPECSSKVVGVAGARGAYRQGDKSSPPPQTSVNALQVGGLGLKGGKKDIDVGGRQGKLKSKTDQANHLFNKKKEGSEGRLKNKHRLAPSLRAYFKVRPEDIVLVLGQGKWIATRLRTLGTAQTLARGLKVTLPP
ncbi:hypothetical protein NDU88_007272 [Pleurodeles waltl]|uniref:Uncharacterized protein n=1 Tax=Pleurodeles waltl TaxID=8319 RepID=A0AAV7N4W5_PLEWA|nr:hypothetical protein NDU88_007272 [Pleurodeles waltl]